ncbi:hypothetical protein Csa_003665, partial [Cucumis sativus]
VIQFVPYEEELLINEINNGSVEEDESTLQRISGLIGHTNDYRDNKRVGSNSSKVSVGQLAFSKVSAELKSPSMGRTKTAIIAFQARKLNRSSVSPVTRYGGLDMSLRPHFVRSHHSSQGMLSIPAFLHPKGYEWRIYLPRVSNDASHYPTIRLSLIFVSCNI